MSGMRLTLPAGMAVLMTAGLAWSQVARYPTRIVTELSGDQVVGSVPTAQLGKAFFKVPSASDLHYRITVTGAQGITGIYIHEGTNRQVGPVIATLYAPQQPTGRVSGTVVEGTLTNADLPARYRDQGVGFVVNQLMNNNAYVEITTVDHPHGFIRGNIPYPY